METTYVYLVTNCYNDSNKVYIGKTIGCRKSNHRKTYGLQITYDYIDKVDSLNRKDWEPIESYWIEQFKGIGKSIIQTDLNDKYITTWNSVMDASKYLNKKTTLIYACCVGDSKTTYGYKWKYCLN